MRAFSQLVQNVDQLNDFLVTYRCCADKRYLVQLLSTQSRDTVTELARAILERLPDTHIIGHSTRHVILEGEIFNHGCLVCVMEFNQTTLTSAVQHYSFSPDIDGYDLKQALELQDSSKAIISFSVQIGRRDYPVYRVFNPEGPTVSGGLAQAIDDGCWSYIKTKFMMKRLWRLLYIVTA